MYADLCWAPAKGPWPSGGRLSGGDFLRQEIAFFEARLHEMGEKGDCAYEHALSRAYETLLRERRGQLTQLQA
jgi:hypothetical protein